VPNLTLAAYAASEDVNPLACSVVTEIAKGAEIS
jgi:hypothetical protein